VRLGRNPGNWFLLLALARQDELPSRAAKSAAMMLRDLLDKRSGGCVNCGSGSAVPAIAALLEFTDGAT
jgi:hypothetical protein